MPAPIIPGAEPVSITGGSQGGVLLLHGYMGSVQNVRDWALALGEAGFSVEAPLLPGHGTSIDDLLDTQWSDYVACAEEAYRSLQERHQRVLVGGICTGSMLAASITLNHPETTSGLMSVNGFFRPPRHWNFSVIEGMAQENRRFFTWFRGKSIEDPEAPALIAYEKAAIAPIVSMRPANIQIWPRLSEIQCPILAFSSLLDRAVPPEDGALWRERVTAPLEHVVLERSNHLATMDYDKGIIEERSVAFALTVASGRYTQPSREVA